MGLGITIADWLTNLLTSNKDGLRGWLLQGIGEGITKSLEDMEPGVKEMSAAAVDRLIATDAVDQEVKDQLEHARVAGNWLETVYLELTILITSLGTLLGGSVPLSNELRYFQDFNKRSSRLDPISMLTAWRRDPAGNEKFFDDLREQGWSEERIEALKLVTEFLPNADEQTLWLAREVFEPEMVEKYGLDDELPDYANTDFSKIGVTPEQMTNKWRAHWEHSSYIQMVEMFRRKLITREDFFEWFKLVEIAPFWREDLITISEAWPTRVDVRRFWDMRTIDEPRLRQLYQGMGYEGENLEDYVRWTKVFTDFPVLLARWSKGWITLDDIRRQLAGLGIPTERIEDFIQEKVQAEQPERTAKERDITKTDIYKGVKQERITRGEGLELLQDLGYSEDEADYLLSINIPDDEVESVVNNRLLTKADVIAGLRSEVLDEDAARQRLLELRYSAVDVQLLLDIFSASIKPPTEPRQREASKADIVKAVKKGLISPEEGYLMLIDIGFEPSAADFILFVNVEESPFSPVDLREFKGITEKWRRATGMTTQAEDDKLREARDELIQITGEVKLLEEAAKNEDRQLVDQEVIPDEAKERLDEINVALNRARSEEIRIRAEYDTLAAEFTQKNRE